VRCEGCEACSITWRTCQTKPVHREKGEPFTSFRIETRVRKCSHYKGERPRRACGAINRSRSKEARYGGTGLRTQFVALLAFAAAIELAQLLVPGRHARLSDFLIDAWGGNCWSVDWLPRLAQAHANDDPSGFNKTLAPFLKAGRPHGTLPLWSCETVVLRHELRRRFLCLTVAFQKVEEGVCEMPATPNTVAIYLLARIHNGDSARSIVKAAAAIDHAHSYHCH